MTEQWKELKETIIELRDSNGIATQQEVCKFLASLMDVLEKQMQEPRWIPVSERLPENKGYYLVSGEGKIWICEMIDLGGLKGWCNDARKPIVKAWMPLPDPYEAESEEKL